MKSFLMALAATLTLSTSLAADKETRFFELRIYHAAPGKLNDLNSRFRDHTMKLFEKHAITSIGYWVPTENTNNVLIYLLAYPTREDRETSWKEFSGDREWQEVQKASEANGKLVEKVESTYLTPTDFSPIIEPSPIGKPLLFELRTYRAAPGKRNDLLARFRDHTMGLFKKHHMGQFGYWIPADKNDTAGDTLIYILAHKDKETATASWKAFQADPVWQSVKAHSEINGPLTVKNGVTSVFMVPTDYSPTK